MTVEMKASKRFRLPHDPAKADSGWKWVDAGEAYTVASAKEADWHEQSGRGKRASSKPAKKEA